VQRTGKVLPHEWTQEAPEPGAVSPAAVGLIRSRKTGCVFTVDFPRIVVPSAPIG